MKKKIKLSVLDKAVIQRAIEFVLEEDVAEYEDTYKNVLKRVVLADEVILVYNIEENESETSE